MSRRKQTPSVDIQMSTVKPDKSSQNPKSPRGSITEKPAPVKKLNKGMDIDELDHSINESESIEFTAVPDPDTLQGQIWAVSRFFRREIVNTEFFQQFILFAIISNCIFLALDKPGLDEDNPKLFDVVSTAEIVYIIIFVVEMVCKMIATGLWHGKYIESYDEEVEADTSEITYSDYEWSERTKLLREKKEKLRNWIRSKKGRKVDEYVGYLNDGWNVLDFIIVISSLVDIAAGGNNASFTPIRILRVLRPLRTFSRVKGLKVLIETLLKSFPKLVDVFVLLAFLFLVFGIAGVQLFKGLLKNRCVDIEYYALNNGEWTEAMWEEYTGDQANFGDPDSFGTYCSSNDDCSGFDGGMWPQVSGVWDEDVPESEQKAYYYKCERIAPRSDPGEFNGMQNFDDIFFAIFNQIQLITLEGWAGMTYDYMNASHWLVLTFFFFFTFITSYFALNLTLAVLANTFGEVDADATVEAEEKASLEKAEREYDAFKKQEEALAMEEQIMATADEAEALLNITGHQDAFLKAAAAAKKSMLKTHHGVGGGFCVESFDKGRVEDKSREDQILAVNALKVIQRDDEVRMKDGFIFILWCNRIALSEVFANFVLLIIMLNAITLAVRWPNMDPELDRILEEINYGFTIFFSLEMGLKLIGLGFWGYIRDGWNVFDGVIVILSVIELISNTSSSIGMKNWGFSSLRMLRILRILRLLGKIQSLRVLIGTLMAAASDVVYLMVVPIIFIFMFAILGVGLFEHEGISDPNFETIGGAILCVFRIVTGDDWNEVMMEHIQTSEAHYKKLYCIYFILIVIFGDWIFMNLFIAILLNRMSEEHYSGRELSEKDLKNHELVCKVNKWIFEDMIAHGTHNLDWRNEKEPVILKKLVTFSSSLRLRVSRTKSEQALLESRDEEKMAGLSFGIFSTTSTIRKYCHWIAHHHYFEIFIDFCIIVNCILLAIEPRKTSKNPDRERKEIYFQFDVVFLVIFVIEMCLKMISDGVTPWPVFAKRSWNLTVSLLNDEDEEKEDDIEYLTKWEHFAELNLMDLQSAHRTVVKRIEGTVVKVTESSDGWIIVQFETFFEEFRLLFKDSGTEWATTVYILATQPSKTEAGTDINRWIPAPGFQNVADIDPTLENIMISSHLNDLRRNAYMANGWNQIDFLVVLVSFTNILPGLQEFAVMRCLRAIRPLRLAVRVEQIRVVVSAVVGAVPGVMSTFCFCILFWTVLAILGTNLFSGKYGACNFADPDYIQHEKDCTLEAACTAYADYSEASVFTDNCICGDDGDPCTDADYDQLGISMVCNDLICRDCWTDDVECLIFNGDDEAFEGVGWGNPTFHFDDVWQSLRTIYIIATLDEWTGIMVNGMSVQDEQFRQPSEVANGWINSLFFVAAVVMTAFLSFNLIISVVVDNFNRIKSEKDGSAFLTQAQKTWVRAKRLIDRVQMTKRYPQPENRWLQVAHKIVLHPFFEPFIIICICVNALTMAMEHDDMSENFSNVLEYIDLVFILVFTIEAVLKLLAIGIQNYFREGWNIFDFIIVVFSWFSYILKAVVGTDAPGISVARIFRIGRVLRLVQKAETLRTLFFTIVYSLPSLWNIGLLLVVVFFVYTIVGMELFGKVQPLGDNGLNEDFANFETFHFSFFLLYRIATGDAWGPLYENCMVQAEPGCEEDDSCDCIAGKTCGNSAEATVYFISFLFIGSLVMINLFIAVILDTFADSLELQKREKDLSPVFVWSQIWSRVDVTARGELEVLDFVHTLMRSPADVGMGDYFQCATLLGNDHELLNCVKDEKKNNRITKQLAQLPKEARNKMEPFPDQNKVIAILKELELLCRRRVDGDGIEKWFVSYRDAVVAVGTSVVGPKIYVQTSEQNEDCVKVHDWFVEYFSVGGKRKEEEEMEFS